MTTYSVTTSNWNSSAFWSSISETGSGHTLDFSALPSNFYIIMDLNTGLLQMNDGATTYRVGDDSYSGSRDADLGGTTNFNQFAMIGGQGWNDFFGDTTDDTFVGGADDDLVDGAGGNDSLAGGGGQDTITGGLGNDTISGGSGNDLIQGNQGDDSLLGGAGDDRFEATDGSGFDTVDGGTGNDTIAFFGPSSVSVDFSTITGGSYTYAGNIAGGSFQSLETFQGSSASDTLDFSAMGTGVSVTFATVEAGTAVVGGDTITFTEFEQIIFSGNGDYIDASALSVARDIDAGAGSDTIIGGSAADTLTGGDGADTFIFNDGFGNDTIIGGEGGTDADVIDLSNLSNPVTVIYTGDEAGTITDGTHTITFSGVERLILTDQADVVDASSDSAGINIEAGLGNDTITGGLGDDEIAGGDGNDTFVYVSGDGNDTITDFNFGNTGALHDGDTTNNDFIDLSGYYDHLSELRADQSDDGILNQSNAFDDRGEAVDYSDNTQFGSGSVTMQGASASSYSNDNTGVDCFTSGTLIHTPAGEVPIEALKVGDLVTTLDNGPQPVRWIGVRSLRLDALSAQPHLKPVLIQPGKLGNRRALLLSPQHGLMLDKDTLVRATHLARMWPGARHALGKRSVTYIHLMFDAHQIIFAEGAPAESFYPGPQGLRMMPSTAREEIGILFPDFTRRRLTDNFVRKSYGEMARVFIKGTELKEQLRMMDVGPPISEWSRQAERCI